MAVALSVADSSGVQILKSSPVCTLIESILRINIVAYSVSPQHPVRKSIVSVIVSKLSETPSKKASTKSCADN